MKELSIEEKAKAYDEALEKAKDYHKQLLDEDNPEWASEIEKIFPELKESEDEQHRKWILECLYDGLRKSDEQFKDQFKSAIAWLEKQGEPNSPSITKEKPWSEYDMSKVQRICKYLTEAKKYYADITEVRECIDWLKSLKGRYTWKPSEEQLDTLKETTNIAGGKYKSCLKLLYQDLMKLKG